MKFIVFSDLHIHNYKAHNIGSSRLDYALDVLNLIGDLSEEHDAVGVIFCGDFFDAQAVPAEVLQKTRPAIANLMDRVLNFYTITGNHEMPRKAKWGREIISAQAVFNQEFPEYKLVDNAFVHVSYGIHIAGLPYYDDIEDFHEAMGKLDVMVSTDRAAHESMGEYFKAILMLHQTPDYGAPFNVDFHQDDYKLFDQYDAIFCGHIHRPMKLNDKFYLIGNPLHRDLGDEGNEKGVWIYDSQYNSMEFISTRGRYPEFKRVHKVDVTNTFDYQIPIIAISDTETEDAQFTSDMKPEYLLGNYADELDLTAYDLKIGLECLD